MIFRENKYMEAKLGSGKINRFLSNADIEHYQKIIVALTETEIIMREIDRIPIC